MNTIPYFVCKETYAQCIKAHPDDLQGQQQCTDAAKCGTLNATAAEASASSSRAAASSTAAASSGSQTASASASGSASGTAASASSSPTGMAVKLGRDYGVGVMAAVFGVAFKFLL